ncbi:MAG: STAS domain-containing protein, partial [Candidatus Dormibacteraceae bacterium]
LKGSRPSFQGGQMQTHQEPLSNAFSESSVLTPDSDVVERKVGDVAVIDIRGPFAGELSVRAFLDRVRQLTHEGKKKFAINLADVSYVDSYGLGGLAAGYNWIDQIGGELKFFAAPQHLLRVLQRLHLDRVFDLYEDEPSALARF